MNDLTLKILFTLFGIHVGVLTWLGKTAWTKIHENAKEIEKLKLNCAACKKEYHDETSHEMKELLDQISAMIDEKLDAWWVKIENNLMNDGRLPPKRRNKSTEN